VLVVRIDERAVEIEQRGATHAAHLPATGGAKRRAVSDKELIVHPDDG
jgi:hypothetical protein